MNTENEESKVIELSHSLAEDLTWLRAIGHVEDRHPCNITNFNEWFRWPFYPDHIKAYFDKGDNLLGVSILLCTEEIALARYDVIKDALVVFNHNHLDNWHTNKALQSLYETAFPDAVREREIMLY